MSVGCRRGTIWALNSPDHREVWGALLKESSDSTEGGHEDGHTSPGRREKPANSFFQLYWTCVYPQQLLLSFEQVFNTRKRL